MSIAANGAMKRFREFRPDGVGQSLWRRDAGGKEARLLLKQKTLPVNPYPVEHAGCPVTQDELLDAVWPDPDEPKISKRVRGLQGLSVSRWIAPNALLPQTAWLVLCLGLIGCQSRQANTGPSIEFSKIPPAAQGGRERVDTIAGRVSGARLGQQIVVYSDSGPWWVQPWAEQPFIPIQVDSTWKTETHLGYDYAALLVHPGYYPPATMDVAPAAGGAVALVKIVKGVGSLPPLPTVPIHFSGYDWNIQMSQAVRGGLNSLYDADNVWTDTKGMLHLRIIKKSDKWTCAHLILTRSLGYGTYRLVVRDTSHLETAAVMSMHTFDPSAGDQHYREMDIEMARWGDVTSKYNAQYGIQPFTYQEMYCNLPSLQDN